MGAAATQSEHWPAYMEFAALPRKIFGRTTVPRDFDIVEKRKVQKQTQKVHAI